MPKSGLLVCGSQSCFTPVPAKFPGSRSVAGVIGLGDVCHGARRGWAADALRGRTHTSGAHFPVSLIARTFCGTLLSWSAYGSRRSSGRSVGTSVVGRVSESPASGVAPMRSSPLLSVALTSLPASFPRWCHVRAARPPLRQVRLDLLGSVTPNAFVTLGWESKEAIFCAILSRLGRETLEQVVVAARRARG